MTNTGASGFSGMRPDGTGRAELLVLAQVADLHTVLRTVAEVFLDHVRAVVDRDVELAEAVLRELVQDGLEQGLVAHVQQRLGAVLGQGPQPLAQAACHEHDPVVAALRGDDVEQGAQSDHPAFLVQERHLTDFPLTHGGQQGRLVLVRPGREEPGLHDLHGRGFQGLAGQQAAPDVAVGDDPLEPAVRLGQQDDLQVDAVQGLGRVPDGGRVAG